MTSGGTKQTRPQTILKRLLAMGLSGDSDS
jgi:hypothetical protein